MPDHRGKRLGPPPRRLHLVPGRESRSQNWRTGSHADCPLLQGHIPTEIHCYLRGRAFAAQSRDTDGHVLKDRNHIHTFQLIEKKPHHMHSFTHTHTCEFILTQKQERKKDTFTDTEIQKHSQRRAPKRQHKNTNSSFLGSSRHLLFSTLGFLAGEGMYAHSTLNPKSHLERGNPCTDLRGFTTGAQSCR